MILLFVLSVLSGVSGHYCNIPQCAGFSLIESLHAKDIRADFIELIWQPKENYSIVNYEVHWYAEPDCFQCGGQLSLLNASVKISVKPCTIYTFEVYGFDSNLTTAPAIIKQVSAPSPLIDGCTVRVGGSWAIIRWFQTIKCSESTHIAVCYGPGILVQIKPFHEDNVVIFHFTNLNENSAYICIAYTLNSAGSSSPSAPVFVKTEKGGQKNIEDVGSTTNFFNNFNFFGTRKYHDVFNRNSGQIIYADYNDLSNEGNGYIMENIMASSAILILILAIISIMTLLHKRRYLHLPWRRSYTVNDTRI